MHCEELWHYQLRIKHNRETLVLETRTIALRWEKRWLPIYIHVTAITLCGCCITHIWGTKQLGSKGVDKRVQKSAVLSLIYGFYSFPLPLGIRSTLGVTFWNWEFDSWLLVVEFWHLRVKFRSESFLDPRESLFHRWKSIWVFWELISGSWSRFWASESQL